VLGDDDARDDGDDGKAAAAAADDDGTDAQVRSSGATAATLYTPMPASMSENGCERAVLRTPHFHTTSADDGGGLSGMSVATVNAVTVSV
jgi:hypothetical protein